MKNRLIVLVAIVLVLLILACSFADLIPRREARITATPTRTPKPTFTATATATHTLTPSPTPIPTNTPTATPIPTNTPIATDTPVPTDTPPPTNTWTPTPISTATDTPPPTNTPKPTSKPKPKPTRKPTQPPAPKPTQPPAPPFTGNVTNGWPNCGTKGVMGYVKHGNGSPYAGARVGVWADAWEGRVSGPSELDGKYAEPLNDLPAGTFHVAVVNVDTCGMRDGAPTAVNCQRLSNVVTVTIFEVHECQNQGTVQWSEVHFTGP